MSFIYHFFFSLRLSLPFWFSLFFLFLFFFFCFPSFFTPSFISFFQIWLQERLQLLQPPTVAPITYIPRLFRDYRLHQNDMSFEAYMELIGHIKKIDIQWVMEWWHISSMVHCCYKDCVPLVGLHCCSYYSICCISRKFGEHQ